VTLGTGLIAAGRAEESLAAYQVAMATLWREGGNGRSIPLGPLIELKTYVANVLTHLSRHEEALTIRQYIYDTISKENDWPCVHRCIAAVNLAVSLVNLERFVEAVAFCRQHIPLVRKALGPNNHTTLEFAAILAGALTNDKNTSLDALMEAESLFVDTAERCQQIFGAAHPRTKRMMHGLYGVRLNIRTLKVRAADRAPGVSDSKPDPPVFCNRDLAEAIKEIDGAPSPQAS
jgi:hypothetical protein